MKKTLLLFTLCAALLGWSGCASSPAAAARKAGITTVQVEPRIDFHGGMRYGFNDATGLIGELGSLVTSSLGQKQVGRMSAVMQTNQISVADLVRSHVSTRLQQYPELQLTSTNGEGVFVVSIEEYGFVTPGLKLSRQVPFLILRAELLDHQGKCLWGSRSDAEQLTSKGLGATWDEYAAHPEKLRADWDQQVEHVVDKFLPVK